MFLTVNLLLIASFVISLALAFYAWKRRPASGSMEFLLLMVATAWWSLTFAFEWSVAGLESKVFWAKMEYFGVANLSVLWMLLALRYTGREKWLTRRNQLLFFIVPLLTLLAIWTNQYHHLMWRDVVIDTGGSVPVLVWDRGLWFWVFTVYTYTLLFLGSIFLLEAVFRSQELYRGQATVLLIGVLVPWISNFLYLLGFDFVVALIPTPVLFTVTGIALAWGLFRFQLLDIVPVAHEAVLESMADAVFVLDMQNRVIDLNPAAQQLVGRLSSEVVGEKLSRALSMSEKSLESHLEKRDGSEEISIEDAEKRNRYFDSQASSLYDRRDRLLGRLLVLRDITERKQIEEALRLARDQALESNRMKSQLLANVSHELRTPLGAILGYSEFLQDGSYGSIKDEQQEPLRKIIESTHYLSDLVSRLLEQAQIEAGRLALYIEPVSLQDMLQKIENKFSVIAESKDLALKFEIDESVPVTVYGDGRKIKQIIINLLGNALKFTAEGEVKVRVFCPDNKHWAVCVSDSGLGIPEDKQEEIFQPFHQIDSSITREYGGVGLGLSIVDQLTDLMGGKITLDSQVGEGSRFTVLVPFYSPEEE